MATTESKPDFLCIGAQKSGTTWLHENLAKHPDVWTPPVKEFHYFNRICMNDKLLGNWDMPHPTGLNRYKGGLLPLSLRKLRWTRRYYEYGLEKRWYLSLFDEVFTQGLVCGDITPGYSTMEERGVRYARDVVGEDTPIIFIARNPVQRSWSAVKMLLGYHRQSVETIARNELVALLNSADITLGSEYSRIIPLWQKYFKNFHVLSYDQLCTDPKTFLSKISAILDIRDLWDDATITKEVWSDKKKIPLPKDLLEMLGNQYRKEIEYLCLSPDSSYAQDWLKELNEL